MSDNGQHLSLTRQPLPRGWAWSTIGEVGVVSLGRQRSPKNRSAEYPTKYIRAANLTWEGIDLSEVLEMDFKPHEREVYRLRPGDVLLSEASGSADQVGKPGVWKLDDDEYCFQNTVIRFRSPEIVPGFANLVFLHYARNAVFAQVAVGIGIHHLGADRLSGMPFPVPPLQEQKRIVEKADKLFSDLDAAIAALGKARTKLRRYRASVLKAAIDGKLTAAWRLDNAQTEPATGLVSRILEQRRRRWEEAQVARFSVGQKEPLKDWQSKYQEPQGPDTSTLRSLPVGWCWAKVNQVGEVKLGRQRSPEHHHGPHMRPYLRVANVFEDRIDTGDVLQMNFTPGEYEVYRLEVGDILLNEGQSLELVGRPAMYRGEVPGSCFQNTLVRFRAYPGLVPEYALYVFLAYLHNKRFQKLARWTVNIAHLGADRFSQVEFPLPPTDEQREIVREIEARLSVIRQLSVQVKANLKRAARLRQSILKRAFEGKLVPQAITDEPATVALERLRRQRAEAPASEADGEGRRSGKRRQEPNEVFFRRVAVVTYIVCRLSDDPSFGRTKLEKILHLTQTHLPYPLGLEFKRYAAGPFDEVIFKDEAIAKKRGWFETKDRPSFGVTYRPGPNADDLCRRATSYLANMQPALDCLLGQLREMTTDDAELLATVYAAWNDLLIDGRPADAEAVIAEVYGWDESKRKFSREGILSRIAWMRQHGYVPTGQGQRTTVLHRKVKLPSSRKKPSR